MAGTQAAAVVRVEVFVEEDEVTPVRVLGVASLLRVTRSTAVLVRGKELCQPSLEIAGHLQ